MNAPATSTRSSQAVAQQRGEQARRLRADHPEMTLEAIGIELGGISKQSVSKLLRAAPVARWPEPVLAAMCEALTAGRPPQEILAIPGVADCIKATRPRGQIAADADAAVATRRLSSLRKLISSGADAEPGTAARRLHDARQAGLSGVVARWPEDVFGAVVRSLSKGAVYAEVLAEVPQLADLLGSERSQAAVELRVLTLTGEHDAPGSRKRRLYEARQAGLRS